MNVHLKISLLFRLTEYLGKMVILRCKLDCISENGILTHFLNNWKVLVCLCPNFRKYSLIVMKLRFTITYLLLKMRDVAFIVLLKKYTKEFEYITVYERRLFEVNFNDVAQHKTVLICYTLLICTSKMFPMQNVGRSICYSFTGTYKIFDCFNCNRLKCAFSVLDFF